MTELRSELYGDALVLTFDGPLNSRTAPALEAEALEAMEPARHVVCDLADVSEISSTGYRLLLRLYHEAATHGGEIALAGLSRERRGTMEHAGFLEFFFVCDSLDEALDRVCRESYGHAGLRV